MRSKPSAAVLAPTDMVGFEKSSDVLAPEEPGRELDGEEIDVQLRASDLYKAHHGGSTQDAIASLRMLASWCESNAEAIDVLQTGRYKRFSFDGYSLTLVMPSAKIANYSTVHHERTWAQVKSGIRSRTSARTNKLKSWTVEYTYSAEDHANFLAGLVQGEIRDGIVVKIVPFGVFVQFTNAVGLIHVSSFGCEEGLGLITAMKVGQSISTIIGDVDFERGQFSLLPNNELSM